MLQLEQNLLSRPGCCFADHEGLPPYHIHADGHILMCGGNSNCFQQPQDEVWLESIVKTHVKMMYAAETLEEPDEPEEFEEPGGMVVIDAYSLCTGRPHLPACFTLHKPMQSQLMGHCHVSRSSLYQHAALGCTRWRMLRSTRL